MCAEMVDFCRPGHIRCMSFKELKIRIIDKVISWPQLVHPPACLQCYFQLAAHFFTSRVFSFRISLLLKMLLLASNSEVLYGHNLYLPSTQYCELNFDA